MTNSIQKSYLLADPAQDLSVSVSAGGAAIDVPATAPDENASVVVLEIAGKVQVIESPSTAPSVR